jgi:hypothetical protein
MKTRTTKWVLWVEGVNERGVKEGDIDDGMW